MNDPEDDPESPYFAELSLSGESLVSSGTYQRYYIVDGKRYHHIIDTDTGLPAQYWHSVSIVTQRSDLADALSTALFLLPLEVGQAILDETGAYAMWVNRNGEIFYSPGFQDNIRT